MSSGSSQSSSQQAAVDPELLDQTRTQIRGLVSEIEALSRSEVTPPEFYEGFLNKLVQALAAEAGAIWVLGEGGRLELAYQINLRNTKLADRKEDQEKHGRCLRKIVTSGQGTLSAPHSGEGDGQTGNPTEYLLVLGPLRSDQEMQGLVEIFQRPNPRPAVERGYLRFVQQMCELAGDYLKTHRLRLFTDRQVMWTQLEQFTRLAHQGLDPRATAYTIANEGRRLIECDRVSVAIKRGGKARVEAVSGQETFDRRSNTIALLDKLARVVVAGGEPVWYSGDTTNMAPQVEEALEAYVDESHTKSIAILPLAKPTDTPRELAEEQTRQDFIGALIIEQITDEAFTQGMMRRIEVVRDHSASAMTNSIEHQSLFLMPLWRTIGKSKVIVASRNLPKTLTVLGIVGAILASLFLIRVDFKLHARGTLEPVEKRNMFAPLDGRVVQISDQARQGQIVQAGQPLLRLESLELAGELEQLEGNVNATIEKVYSLTQQRSKLKDRTEVARVEGEILEQGKLLAGYEESLKVARVKEKQLIVHSPITGEILTWLPLDKLNARPVQTGQVLLTVADPTKDWDLEILMAEDRMGHILRAVREQKTDALEVEYVAQTDPNVTYRGTIKSIHPIAEVHGEDGNVVLIRVKVENPQQLKTEPRPGATVNARIYCGRSSLGYSLFHDLIAWWQTRVAFRFF